MKNIIIIFSTLTKVNCLSEKINSLKFGGRKKIYEIFNQKTRKPEGYYPTTTELKNNNLGSLINAIKDYHGGFEKIKI